MSQRTDRAKAREAILLLTAESDLSAQQYADAFGLKIGYIGVLRRKLGIVNKISFDHLAERNTQIEELFRSGRTLDDIGVMYGITRERCRQILLARGVPADASKTVRAISFAKQRELQRKHIWDERCTLVYGCSFDRARELNDGKLFSSKGCKARLYIEQRRNSLRRGIAWGMTFPEWCGMWDQSGKWAERGRGKYVMGRIGDSGPYTINNVEIITAAQNSRDSYITHPAIKRFASRKGLNDPAHMSPRIKQAAELIKQGKTVDDVAQILGIHRRNAWQLVDQAKRKMALLEQRVAA